MERMVPTVPLPLFHAPHNTPPVAGPVQHDDPFDANYAQPPAPPVYQHLPPDLAQRLAALPPLLPVRGRGRGRGQIDRGQIGRGHGCGRGHGQGQPPVWNANPIHPDPPVHPAVRLFLLLVFYVD